MSTMTCTNKPLTDSFRLFKTLARVTRFHGPTDPGLVAGVRRALAIMPFFRDHFARVRGEPCTDQHLFDMAGTVTTTLACYRTGEGLSRPRQQVRRIALEVLDRGVILTEEDVSALFR